MNFCKKQQFFAVKFRVYEEKCDRKSAWRRFTRICLSSTSVGRWSAGDFFSVNVPCLSKYGWTSRYVVLVEWHCIAMHSARCQCVLQSFPSAMVTFSSTVKRFFKSVPCCCNTGICATVGCGSGHQHMAGKHFNLPVLLNLKRCSHKHTILNTLKHVGTQVARQGVLKLIKILSLGARIVWTEAGRCLTCNRTTKWCSC
jgi:hypothetical protein